MFHCLNIQKFIFLFSDGCRWLLIFFSLINNTSYLFLISATILVTSRSLTGHLLSLVSCSLVKLSCLLWFFLPIMVIPKVSCILTLFTVTDGLLLKAICFFIVCFKGILWGLVLRYIPLARISYCLCQASEGPDNPGPLEMTFLAWFTRATQVVRILASSHLRASLLIILSEDSPPPCTG